MRLSTLFTGYLFLLTTCAFGQLRHQVTWKTDEGTIETGKLRYFGLKSPNDFHFVKFMEGSNKTERIIFQPGKTLEWAVHKQDTLIRQYAYRGNNHYVQLLYTGDVQLYKVITTQHLERYFLVYHGEWYHLQNSVPREATYQILRQNCQTIRLPKRIRNAQDAMELCRQMNECLGAKKHHSYLNQWSDRNELGLSYDFFANKGINNGPYSRHNRHGIFVARYGLETHIPHAQRKLSLIYNRHLLRFYPNILGQLHSSIVGFNIKSRSDLQPNSHQRYPADEHLAMTVWYLDPGIEIRSGYQRRFQLLIGGGAAFGIPIYTKRSIEQLGRVETLQGKPIFQEARNLVKTKPGYHYHFGFNLNFGEMDIATRLRYHHLAQDFRHRDHHNFLYSNLFPQKPRLAEQDHVQLQIRLNYRW